MAEKTFKGIVLLNKKQYNEYYESNPILKDGCPVICVITPEAGVEADSKLMMKVGDGTTAFRSLPWLSGLSADVYDWALQETKPTYTASEIGGLADFVTGEIINLIYPVGSIYISTVNTNPGTLFGIGAWERYGNGKALVGVDENDIDFNIASKTGGEKTHILTENEIPSQSHFIYNNESIGSEPHHVWATEWKNIDPTDIKGSCMPFSGGGNEAHNNLPPYITCYMWKRVG